MNYAIRVEQLKTEMLSSVSIFAVLLRKEPFCLTVCVFCRFCIYLCIGMKVESSILVLDLPMRCVIHINIVLLFLTSALSCRRFFLACFVLPNVLLCISPWHQFIATFYYRIIHFIFLFLRLVWCIYYWTCTINSLEK